MCGAEEATSDRRALLACFAVRSGAWKRCQTSMEASVILFWSLSAISSDTRTWNNVPTDPVCCQRCSWGNSRALAWYAWAASDPAALRGGWLISSGRGTAKSFFIGRAIGTMGARPAARLSTPPSALRLRRAPLRGRRPPSSQTRTLQTRHLVQPGYTNTRTACRLGGTVQVAEAGRPPLSRVHSVVEWRA